jgi:acyl-CoA synthetase (AMP-forming)/AMP-acid ligase II
VRTDGPIPDELLVRGPMRCLGYLDEQDNREAFAEGGWFRTGDLGVVEHGRLAVTGRLKETVSRKGLKISLAEIDDVVRGLPGVQEAAAFAVPDTETGERLAIAVAVADPAAVDFDEVIAFFLAAGMAKWKLPEQVVVWDGPLPRTETGKIQRRRLADDSRPRPTLLAARLCST